MADYYAILKRAIGALPEPTGEARRAVYEKARTALVAQLKSFDPPLSASDITQQRLQLEDAIRKVESEAAKGLLSQALSRAAVPERAAAAASPAPAPRQSDPQPASVPVAQAAKPAPVTAPQPHPERQTQAPAAAALFSRADREPTGQTVTRPPLATPEPTTPTRPPLARPQFEPATRPPVTREAPTGSRPAPITPAPANPAPPPQLAAQGPQNPPPTFSRERAPTGQTSAASTPPPMPAYYEQEDVTQPVASRAFRSAVKDMDRLGTAAHESARRAREALGGSDASPTGDTTMPVDAARKAGRRPLTAQSKPAGNSAPPPLNPPVVVPRKTSRWPIVVGLIVAALVLLGGGGLYWKRDVIASYLGAQKPIIDLVQRSASEKPFVKSTDRLTPDDGAQKAPANPGVKVVTTQPITPSADQTPAAPAARGDATPNQPAANPGASPAAPAPASTQPQAAPAATPTPQASATSPAPGPAQVPNADVPPIAQKVTLLEEAADGNAPPLQSEGKVIWQLVKTPSTQAGKADTVRLQGRVEVPTRGIVLMVTVEQNSDAGLQASHLIKLDFKLPPDFDSKSVARVPGVILKPAEGARGDPLAGATAKITSNLFWIALYSADADKTRNIQLLKERGWIDIPIVYETNKRAMLTLEKAGAGDRVFSDAFAAWGN